MEEVAGSPGPQRWGRPPPGRQAHQQETHRCMTRDERRKGEKVDRTIAGGPVGGDEAGYVGTGQRWITSIDFGCMIN